MRGWGLGERLDLLFDNGDSGNDLDSDEEGTWGIVKWMEHLVNHRSHCESPWLAEKEATFPLGTGSKRRMAKGQRGHSGWNAAS